MDHKTLTIAPIVVSLAVILVLGVNIGLIASVSGAPRPQGPPADPANFGPNCVGCITSQNLANGAITHSKIALHSVDQTQLTFTIHNGTNGAQGPAGPIGQTGATATGKLVVVEAVWNRLIGGGQAVPSQFTAHDYAGITPSVNNTGPNISGSPDYVVPPDWPAASSCSIVNLNSYHHAPASAPK
jgi:hypothetical protein